MQRTNFGTDAVTLARYLSCGMKTIGSLATQAERRRGPTRGLRFRLLFLERLDGNWRQRDRRRHRSRDRLGGGKALEAADRHGHGLRAIGHYRERAAGAVWALEDLVDGGLALRAHADAPADRQRLRVRRLSYPAQREQQDQPDEAGNRDCAGYHRVRLVVS